MSEQIEGMWYAYNKYIKHIDAMYYSRYQDFITPEIIDHFMPFVIGNRLDYSENFALKIPLKKDIWISSNCLDLFEQILEMDHYIENAKVIGYQTRDTHELYITVVHHSADVDILRDRIYKIAHYFFDGVS